MSQITEHSDNEGSRYHSLLKKSVVWPGRGSNLRPPGREADALTTRPSLQKYLCNNDNLCQSYNYYNNYNNDVILKFRFVSACICLTGVDVGADHTLASIGVGPNGAVQLEISSSDPVNVPLRAPKPKPEYNMPDIITTRIERGTWAWLLWILQFNLFGKIKQSISI